MKTAFKQTYKKTYFTFSLLLISYLLSSCGEKKIWKMGEPSLVINPTFKGLHKKINKNTKQHTSIKNKVPYDIGVSQFKNFLDLHLNLNSQLHFQNKDIGLILKVTSVCAVQKSYEKKLIYITHVSKIKIKKKLSFISFFPEEVIDLLGNEVACHLSFLVKNNMGDRHNFKLSHKMIKIQRFSKNIDVENNAINLKIFKSEYKKNAKEQQIRLETKKKKTIYFFGFQEKNLDKFYIKVLDKTESLSLSCANKELNTTVKLKTFNHKHFFISEFIENKKINRHDISASTLCNIIKRDHLNNIIESSSLFTISLSNITKTPPPRQPYIRFCPNGKVSVDNGRKCIHT